MDIGEALTAAAKGAAQGAMVGAVAGPAGAALGGLGGLVLDIAPGIGRWLFGDAGGKTAAAVAGAVQAVTGTSDADAAMAAIGRDPQVMANLRIELARIAAAAEAEANRAAEARQAAALEEFKAQLADAANARAQTIALAQAGSKIAWGAPVVSVFVLSIFAVALWEVFRIPPGEASATQIGMVETLKVVSVAVVSYWVGSSRGSAVKDERIEKLTAGGGK
ncbi:MAG TPA: hypothetical protein VFL96_15535 [Acidobacteriaceae bacterium]|jgi:hypothetical protein|nr:hypothetical protein [Acidobacteriaceae bacterium]